MAEHELHCSQVGAVLDEVGCEGVAQNVRAEGRSNSCADSVLAEDFPESLASEGASAMVEEDLGAAFPYEIRATFFEKVVEPVGGGVAEGDQAFLATFADNSDEGRIQVQLVETKTHELGDAQSGCVQGFDHGPVSQSEEGVGVGDLEQLLDVFGRQGMRHRVPELRVLNVGGGISFDHFRQQEKAIESAHRRQCSCGGPCGQAGVPAESEIAANLMALDVGEINAVFREPREKSSEVSAIGRNRVGAHVSLDRQMGKELMQGVFRVSHMAIIAGGGSFCCLGALAILEC